MQLPFLSTLLAQYDTCQQLPIQDKKEGKATLPVWGACSRRQIQANNADLSDEASSMLRLMVNQHANHLSAKLTAQYSPVSVRPRQVRKDRFTVGERLSLIGL